MFRCVFDPALQEAPGALLLPQTHGVDFTFSLTPCRDTHTLTRQMLEIPANNTSVPMRTPAARAARAAALTLVLTLSAPALAAQTPAASTLPGVAILDFDNGSLLRDLDYNALGKGIADMLISDLAGGGTMRLVDREHMQRVLQEQDMAGARRVDPETAVRLGKIVGARYFMTGSVLVDASRTMVLTVHIVDTETSVLLPWTAKIQGKSDEALRLIADLGERINSGLKLPQLAPRPAEASTGTANPRPGDRQVSAQDKYRAFYLVSRSIEEQDKKNYPAAMALLREALDVYPDYDRARTRLASLQRAGSGGDAGR
jgi:TolB-like protein